MKSPPPWMALMHELSICEAVLQQALTIARSNNGSSVLSITLRIGPLSGVEPELLRAAFPLVAHGTRCEAAQIDIQTIPVVVRCNHCSTVSEVSPNRLVCASCGAWQVTLMSGDDMLLESVELRVNAKSHYQAECFPRPREGEQISV